MRRVTGLLLMVFSFNNLPPLVVNFIYGESVVMPFVMAFVITFATGGLIWYPARHAVAELKTRDGFLVTTIFWVVLGVFGAIPLHYAAEAWHSVTDAIFESVSGLTTTGATTVASGIDTLPHALNFYRVQLHWLGGVGIIVLAVAVMPLLGVGGMQLFRAETPGPMKDAKLTPRIRETARLLWYIYAVLTVICTLTYWLLGMPFFDALCHGMSTMATGGFSTHDASIGYYQNVWIEIAVMVFMLVGATNFALHYLALSGRSLRVYWRDSEFRAMVATALMLGVLVCAPLYFYGTYPDAGSAIRYGLFQLIAYGSTSGFATADPTLWPAYVPMLIILATFMFSCAGSTGGGVKMVRLVLFLKQAGRELQVLVHPSAQFVIKLDRKSVPDEIVYAVGGFFSVYIGLTAVFTFVMMLTGMDAVTAFSAVAASMNNAGPGLGPVVTSVAAVTDSGKWVMILAMIIGRLEIFTFLVLLTPAYWRR